MTINRELKTCKLSLETEQWSLLVQKKTKHDNREERLLSDNFPVSFPALALSTAVDLLTTHDMTADNDDEQETPIYEKFDAMLHGKEKKKWEEQNA